MERALQTSADVAGVVVTMIVQREEDAHPYVGIVQEKLTQRAGPIRRF